MLEGGIRPGADATGRNYNRLSLGLDTNYFRPQAAYSVGMNNQDQQESNSSNSDTLRIFSVDATNRVPYLPSEADNSIVRDLDITF
jgi:hypothetical protein